MLRYLRWMFGWIALACLLVACSGDGASGGGTMPVRACASGETRVCACSGGVMGAQAGLGGNVAVLCGNNPACGRGHQAIETT